MTSQADTTGNTHGRRRMTLALIPVVVFAALAILLFSHLKQGGDPSKLPSALIGKPAPEFSLPPVEALVSASGALPGLASSDLRQGKVTVINVWASWCGPCRVEHPVLMEMANRSDIVLTGINYKDAPENARRFLGMLGNPYAAVGADNTGRAAVDFGVYGVPETFVVDGNGIIRHKHVGPLTPEAVSGAFNEAIARASR